MQAKRPTSPNKVKKLTQLLLAFILFQTSACSFRTHYNKYQCNSRAYVSTDVAEYVSARFSSPSNVRLGIVPFSVPANLAQRGDLYNDLASSMARRLQGGMLEIGVFGIAEIFNRPDWPQKREEFFTGNFGAMSLARDAGYDFILIGLIDELRSAHNLTIYSKVIEVESGITLWFAKSEYQEQNDQEKIHFPTLQVVNETMDFGNWNSFIERGADCVAHEIYQTRRFK